MVVRVDPISKCYQMTTADCDADLIVRPGESPSRRATPIAKDAHFDGKWLIRISDNSLTPTDLAKAYKQLHRVEHGWRDMKGAPRLRPVFHHREDRIRSHIQLCWLGLLLIRVVENATGDTWRNVRNELERMHLVTLGTKEGRIAKRSVTTNGQRKILAALKVREPAQILDYELPTPVE